MQVVRPLSQSEVERVHSASLDLLENVGLRIEHDELLRRLRAGGARVSEANANVRFPRSLMAELLARVPSSHTIHHPDGTRDVVKIGSRFLSGMVSEPKMIDYETGRPRPPQLADIRRNNILCQKTAAVKNAYLMEVPILEDNFATPSLLSMEEYLVNNGKHIFHFGTSLEHLERYRTVTRIIAESQGIPAGGLVTVSCPVISPLKVGQFHGECLLRCSEAGFAICGTMCSTAGATGPYSLAGNLVLANTENLFVAAVTQILKPGSAFLYMYSPSVLNMTDGSLKFYSMDKVLSKGATGQMAAFYNVPFMLDGGGSMTCRFDVQSGVESFASMLAAFSVNPSWIGGQGCFYNALGFSREMAVIHNAWFEVAKFLEQGIRIDDERLAVESIQRVGQGGDFLADDLTVRMLREGEFFGNDLFDLSGRETGKTMLDRAHEKVEDLVAKFESPLPHGLQEKLRRYFHDARKKAER